MSGYVDIKASRVATGSDSASALKNAKFMVDDAFYPDSYTRISSSHSESKFIYGSIFTGILFAAALALANIGVTSSNNNNNYSIVKPLTLSGINRNAIGDEDSEDDEDLNESDRLQNLFGFNTAQWAKILKVERKTIYNWRGSPDTKIKASAAQKLSVLSKFAEEFNPQHANFLGKFLFGRKADADFLSAFLKEPLDFNELLNQYDNIYTKLDGMAKRSYMLDE